MDKLTLLDAVSQILNVVYGEVDSTAVTDIKLLPALREYREIVSRGDKKSYATYYLAEKYGISEKTIRRAVKRLGL